MFKYFWECGQPIYRVSFDWTRRIWKSMLAFGLGGTSGAGICTVPCLECLTRMPLRTVGIHCKLSKRGIHHAEYSCSSHDSLPWQTSSGRRATSVKWWRVISFIWHQCDSTNRPRSLRRVMQAFHFCWSDAWGRGQTCRQHLSRRWRTPIGCCQHWFSGLLGFGAVFWGWKWMRCWRRGTWSQNCRLKFSWTQRQHSRSNCAYACIGLFS